MAQHRPVNFFGAIKISSSSTWRKTRMLIKSNGTYLLPGEEKCKLEKNAS